MDPRQAQEQPPFRGEREQSQPGREADMKNRPDFGEQSYVGHGRLQGKKALITGGDSGIGRAVALAFAREGADVAIAYLNEHEDARETRRLIEAEGRRGLEIAADLATESECRRVVEKAHEAFGTIDIIVNNAAFQGKAVERFEEFDASRVERTFAVNVMAMFHIVRAALPYMKAGGSIINTASIQAYDPSAPILDYASTKGAIVTFTKGLAQHLIERGIRVNSIAPGPVWTPLIAQSFDEKKIREFGKDSPMGRPAQPAELAPPFVFLACDESRYVNGEILGVTGGRPLA